MRILFIAILFTNSILAFSFLIMCLQRRSGDLLEKTLIYVTGSSLFWSLGAALLVSQYNDKWTHIFRCMDLFGTVSFMVSIIMLLNCIAEYDGKYYLMFHAFSLLGYVLLIFSFFPDIYTFTLSDWGMSFQFKNQIYGYVYVIFFVLCTLIMIFYLVTMQRARRRAYHFSVKHFL